MRRTFSLLLAAGLGAGSACSKPAPAPQAPSTTSPAGEASSTTTAPAATPANGDVASRVKQLNALLEEQWQHQLRNSPEMASMLGDLRYNNRWSDGSLEAVAVELEQTRAFLARFEAIDTTGMPEQDALNQRLMVRELKEQLDDARFEPWLMPIDQMGGVHLGLAQFVSLLRFQTVKDYEDYLKRLDGVPRVFEDSIARARLGLKKGLIEPRFLLEKVVGQAQGIASQKPEDSPFAAPVKSFPDAIPAANQARLRAAVLAAVKDKVLPSYKVFTAFVRDEYAPKGRKDIGTWSLPDGEARYASAIVNGTTTRMTADEIHQLGLAEVARIEGEAAAIAKKLGFKDLKALNAKVKKDKALFAKSRQDILDRYQRFTDAMYKEVPRLFGRLPKQQMKILPTEPFREKSAAGAEYMPGAPDGSRPGTVRVNTADPGKRSITDIESTAYHEGIPGHHFQLAIAQELGELPPFRRYSEQNAYVEGWALYSEHLGKELGFYQDPYSDYGHLQSEMLRAIRLVVDTGIHHKKWTRDQVVKFFHDHSSIDEPTVQNETDRYIVWPGQALGYKVGQLTILRLRAKAQEALGGSFDVRGFHDEILGGGALPLDVLEERIDTWIARQKSGAKAGASGASSR